MVYTNDDATTNLGVSGLNVALYCDEGSNTTIYSNLTSNTLKNYYYTSMTNDANCAIYTYNSLV